MRPETEKYGKHNKAGDMDNGSSEFLNGSSGIEFEKVQSVVYGQSEEGKKNNLD